MTFATVSLAPASPAIASPLSTNTVTVSLDAGGDDDDDEIAGISSSLGVSELTGTLSSLGTVSAVSAIPPVPSQSTADSMKMLELEDALEDLRKAVAEKDAELQSKRDEVACLSASLLEKDRLIRGEFVV